MLKTGNINSFLKPSSRKITLFSLLFIIIPTSILLIANTYSGFKTPLAVDLYGTFVLLPSYLINTAEESLGIYISIVPKFINTFIVVLIPLLTIFWWYMIACSIISIYDKINKIKERKKIKPLL